MLVSLIFPRKKIMRSCSLKPGSVQLLQKQSSFHVCQDKKSWSEGTILAPSRGFHFCLKERKASLSVSPPTFQGFDSTCCHLRRCFIAGVDFDFYIEHPKKLKLEAVDKVTPRRFKIDVLSAFKNNMRFCLRCKSLCRLIIMQ